MGDVQKISSRELKSERIIYFDFLRIIATVAVIMLHTSATNWVLLDVHSFSWNVFNFYDGIVRWAVPVFTMISGALFLDNKRELDIRTLYSKNVFRIVIAFAFWSTVYALEIFAREKGTIASLLVEIIGGHYHMWFLFMIVGLYMITPLLRRITKNQKDTRYFLLLSFIFTFFIPAVFLVLKVADTLLRTGGTLYNLANAVYDNVNFHFAVGYSFYYVLGYYISSTDFNKKVERIIYVLGVVGFVSTVLLTKDISYYFGSPNQTFFGNMTINVMLESVAVFTFAKYKVANWIKTEKQKLVVEILSKYSFGIYLVHAEFISVLWRLGLTTLSFTPIFSVIVIVVIVFVLSFAVSAILHKIPVVNKYLV